MNYPLRQRSAHGVPRPESPFERTCERCGASFLDLAPGKTGERGVWNCLGGMRWYCSVECAP